jgi:isopentenyl diphosphate isomerase/L-lactate dehydrogenase-like FMN-dependent dehydrogenase
VNDPVSNSPLAPALAPRLDRFDTIHEVIKAARNNITRNAWDYMIGGAESETTLRRNRLALDSLALRPRVLRDVSNMDRTTTLLGHKLRLPVLLAPIGSLQSLHETGAMAPAKAAERFGTISILSSVTTPDLDEIARETSHPKIFQLYVRGDRAWVDDYVKRAIDLGYVAFCFTVDTAVYGRRERDIIKRHRPTARTNLDPMGPLYQAALNWDDMRRFKDRYDIPLVIKGIATAEDAETAVGFGCDVVYVSNHGGRQLDHGRGTVEVLPEVVEAVGGKAKVVVDGGINRGTDVVKAIALGADAVAIGRLCGYGAAADGAEGVHRVLEILETEITVAMANLGVASFDELDDSFVRKATPTNPPHVFSAFNNLDIDLGDY